MPLKNKWIPVIVKSVFVLPVIASVLWAGGCVEREAGHDHGYHRFYDHGWRR